MSRVSTSDLCCVLLDVQMRRAGSLKPYTCVLRLPYTCVLRLPCPRTPKNGSLQRKPFGPFFSPSSHSSFAPLEKAMLKFFFAHFFPSFPPPTHTNHTAQAFMHNAQREREDRKAQRKPAERRCFFLPIASFPPNLPILPFASLCPHRTPHPTHDTLTSHTPRTRTYRQPPHLCQPWCA